MSSLHLTPAPCVTMNGGRFAQYQFVQTVSQFVQTVSPLVNGLTNDK